MLRDECDSRIPHQFVNYKHGRYALKNCPICGNKTYGTHCSNKCSAVTNLRLLFEKIDRGEYVAKPNGGNTTLKKYLIARRGKRCEVCKNALWMGMEIPLTSHHIDGDANNNHPCNLQLLCWNCHALTPNYGKKNKGRSARVDRKHASLVFNSSIRPFQGHGEGAIPS